MDANFSASDVRIYNHDGQHLCLGNFCDWVMWPLQRTNPTYKEQAGLSAIHLVFVEYCRSWRIESSDEEKLRCFRSIPLGYIVRLHVSQAYGTNMHPVESNASNFYIEWCMRPLMCFFVYCFVLLLAKFTILSNMFVCRVVCLSVSLSVLSSITHEHLTYHHQTLSTYVLYKTRSPD